MKKRTLIITAILTLLLGVVVGVAVERSGVLNNFEKSQPSGVDKLTWVMDLIDNRYVDNVSRDSLLDLVVPYLIGQLDPHSEFIAAKDLAATNEVIEGKFDGIGVVFNMATDTAIVLNVISGGPSAKAGVEAGDRIITVDDSIIAGVKIDQMKVVGKLRGKRGTKVRLGVSRGDSPKLLDLTIVRNEIPVTSVEAAFISRENAAYVRILRFAANTYAETVEAIDKLVKKGATSIVLDLRGNGGGLLDQSLMLANEFLSKGEGIVYVEGAHYKREEQLADGSGAFQNIPLYVLIDESSASASEIFAGAIQDNERGMIIGRRSFGKGLIQEQIGFKDGSAARITIARYYTPLGRQLQKPYTKGDASAYQAELYERYNNKEMITGIHAADSTAPAFTTKSGRTLYGGGGITPDVFVPIDTVALPAYFMSLYQHNAIFSYAQKFADSHRAKINTINSIEQLETFFAAQKDLYNDFIAYAQSKGVARPSQTEVDKAKKIVMAQLHAYIGRNTPLQENAFYFYAQMLDNVTLKLAEQLNGKSTH